MPVLYRGVALSLRESTKTPYAEHVARMEMLQNVVDYLKPQNRLRLRVLREDTKLGYGFTAEVAFKAFIPIFQDELIATILRLYGGWNELRIIEQQPVTHIGPTAEDDDVEFFESRAWKELRYKALLRDRACCQCCGRRGALDGVILQADHILPRSARPDLALSLDNLQVLCRDCNEGKGAWDSTSWRLFEFGDVSLEPYWPGEHG